LIEVIRGGLASTVQDLGRQKYFSIALVRSGAMDTFSLRAGNLLVGNELEEAGLEVSVGLKLRALRTTVIAITGGDLSPKINEADAPIWEAIKFCRGDVLSFGLIKSGFRAYVSIAGGVKVPILFGSKSTYVSGRRGDLGFGGFKGRLLRKNDILEVGKPRMPISSLHGRRLKSSVIPRYKDTWEIRVVLGPFDHFLEEASLEALLNEPWKVSQKAGRTGYWYDGPVLQFKRRGKQQMRGAGAHPSNYISDGIPVGGIQAPFGVPVVFCVDQATIGAHVKIATVITVDMDRIGQSKPGDTTYFRPESIENAREKLDCYHELFTEKRALV
jgi:antagonist of KipI